MKNPSTLLLICCLTFLFVFLLTPLVHATANSTGGIIITSISTQNFSGLPNKDFDGTFTVTNNGTLLQNIRISQTGLGSLDIVFAPEKFDLGAGQSQNVHFDIESDAGDEDLFKGIIIAQSDASHKDFFSLSINLSTERFAAVRASDVFLGRIELNNGTNTTGFYPGQLVELEIFFENNYRKSTDPIIESFRRFEVFFEDFSDESTTDFEPEFGDISLSIEPASIRSIKSKQFRIPFDTTNNRSYKLQLDLEAEDSENRVFPINYTSLIVVNREEERVGFSTLQ